MSQSIPEEYIKYSLQQVLALPIDETILMSEQIAISPEFAGLNAVEHNVICHSAILPGCIYQEHEGQVVKKIIKKEDFVPVLGGNEMRDFIEIPNDQIGDMNERVMHIGHIGEGNVIEAKVVEYRSSYQVLSGSRTANLCILNSKEYTTWDLCCLDTLRSDYVKGFFACYVISNGLISNEFNIVDDVPRALNAQESKVETDKFCTPIIRQVVEGMLVGCTLNWYISNHYVGTDTLSPFIVKILTLLGAFKNNITAQQIKNLKNDVHQMFHAFSVRNVLALLMPKVCSLLIPLGFPIPKAIKTDNFLAIRLSSAPAGTHKLANCVAGLKIIADMRLANYYPRFNSARVILGHFATVMRNRASFHVGAVYLTRGVGHAPVRNIPVWDETMLAGVLSDIKYLLVAAISSHTLLKSPIITHSTEADMNQVWKSVVDAYVTLVNAVPDNVAKNISKLLSHVSADYTKIADQRALTAISQSNDRMCELFSKSVGAAQNGDLIEEEQEESLEKFSKQQIEFVKLQQELLDKAQQDMLAGRGQGGN